MKKYSDYCSLTRHVGLLELKMFAPSTEQELLKRAHNLAGLTLAEVAAKLDWAVPHTLKQDKGWQGQLLERALGATAQTKPTPDFEHLGIELKTIPVNQLGKPNESTFICTLSLLEEGSKTWKASVVYNKLAHVLWIPILSDAALTIGQRRIGMPLLWRLNSEQEAVLQEDWQELTDMVSMGRLEEITAHHGRYLQIRPKGANAYSLCKGISIDGSIIQTLPRGFYLRALFTEQLLRNNYLVSTNSR